jgi:hypothetical protein
MPILTLTLAVCDAVGCSTRLGLDHSITSQPYNGIKRLGWGVRAYSAQVYCPEHKEQAE